MVKRRSTTKTAFEGDIMQACRLNEGAITEILDQKQHARPQISRKKMSDASQQLTNSGETITGGGANRLTGASHVRVRVSERPK